MNYTLSVNEFVHGKMFDSNGKVSHRTGYRIKLFPFNTQGNSKPVLELSPLIGKVLCTIEEKQPNLISVNDLVELLKDETEIESGQSELFAEVVRQLFYDEKGRMRPLNLQMLEQVSSEELTEIRLAEYLVDVLGDKGTLSRLMQEANERSICDSNVLEGLVLAKLGSSPAERRMERPYFRVTDSLKAAFEEDFEYVLENNQRSREYLVSLFEFYYFSYTAQTCLKLDQFLDGSRDDNCPLYFSLEWEKTSQSRQCYTEGWQRLQPALDRIFAHVVTLEILNHTEDDKEQYDYIKIRKLIDSEPEKEPEIAHEIDKITLLYRKAVECVELQEVKKDEGPSNSVAASIRFLFKSVRVQFENTERVRPYRTYASKFELYCRRKFLKSRGRSGSMLNLSEETLIFLTKMCIKNKERMRLKDVFAGFERRGVFLDGLSKEQVALYYEKLNLIEKKSDSGDAKYVKRVL